MHITPLERKTFHFITLLAMAECLVANEIFYCIILTVLSECKMEKRNSQCEHGQPLKQTSSMFCMCHSGVACCQSQHQCHFLRMSSFEAYCIGK